MKKMVRVCIVVFVVVISLSFFACTMPQLPEFSCNGTVILNDFGLENVKIKSSVNEYTVTNQFGEYSFTTQTKSLVIFPEKDGYIFEPKFAVLTEGKNVVHFNAKPIENLEGNLKLSKVVIKPTNILAGTENYQYTNNLKKALKISEISILLGDNVYSISGVDGTFLNKHEANEIIFNNNAIVACGDNLKLGILINTYFIMYYHEAKTTTTNYSYLYINQPQTNAMLFNNTITYNLYGVNNQSKAFTFDVSFVFEYINN